MQVFGILGCQLIYYVNIAFFELIAELRRPEGPPSGTPYPYRNLKETHEFDFLMVIMASGIARGR